MGGSDVLIFANLLPDTVPVYKAATEERHKHERHVSCLQEVQSGMIQINT